MTRPCGFWVRVPLFPSLNIINELFGSTGSRFSIGGEVRIFDVDPAFWTRIPLFGPGSHPDPTPDPIFGTPYFKHFAAPRNKHESYATAFSVTAATSKCGHPLRQPHLLFGWEGCLRSGFIGSLIHRFIDFSIHWFTGSSIRGFIDRFID